MKKLGIALLVILIITLNGCIGGDFICAYNPDMAMCEINYVPITNDTTGDVVSDLQLNVIDRAEDYDFTIDTIGTFAYSGNPDIPYVDAEEFLYVLQDGLAYYEVTIDDAFTVSYTVLGGGNEDSLTYEMSLEIDLVNQTIFYSDFNFSGSFNGVADIDYETDILPLSSEYVEGEIEKTISLEEYNMQVVEEDGVYFMPLYLANLLFTGDHINVYKKANDMYIIDYFSEAVDVLDNSDISGSLDLDNILSNTVNYTALFFDYFYGLKNFKEVVSYKQVFEQKGFYDVTTFEEFDELLTLFVYELDDLHTSIYDYGYNGSAIEVDYPYTSSKLLDFYSIYTEDYCQVRDYEVKLTEYDRYYILEVNEFSLETKTLLAETLVNLDSRKPIIVDVGCNSGGALIAVWELLFYMTDQSISFYSSMPATNEMSHDVFYLENSRALDNDFYIFTSKMTFSAANLFTSMAKDNNVARVIGDHTSGGACAVIFTVLPNNLVLTHSSHFAMVDKNYDIIEDGVAPDFYYEESHEASEVFAEIFKDSSILVTTNLTDQSTINLIDFEVSCTKKTDLISIKSMRLEVIDPIDQSIIDAYQINGRVLDYTDPISNVSSYTINIYCRYEYYGVEVDYLLYSKTIS
jgi:SAM-dependent methyltransferase